MDVISLFGETGWVSESKWTERCELLRSMASTYFVVVIVKHGRTEEEDRVVATGTVFFEHKFLHGLGVVGHVEDIAVARDQKGKRMGLRVLEALLFAARERGCYKVSLAQSVA
jgi:glucosamine-phosphate N-acetyltransferase